MRFVSLMLLAFAVSGLPRAHAQLLGSNLVPNPSFEASTRTGSPAHWTKYARGRTSGTFTYPALPPKSGFKAAAVAISAFEDGEAGWEFDPTAVVAGTYVYIDSYRADAPTVIEAEFRHADGSVSDEDLALLPSAPTYTQAVIPIEVPEGVSSVTVRHVLRSTGTLLVDDVWFCLRTAVPVAAGTFPHKPIAAGPFSVFALLPIAMRRKPFT